MADLGDRIHRHFIDVSISEKKPAAFFQLYIFITFLSVIFLINHREFFYWYIPLLGVSGLAAILTRDAAAFFGRFIPQRLLAPTSCALFALLCYAAYGRTRDWTQSRREWQQGIAGDYRAFVRGLQSIPAPPPGETLFFRSYPQYFDRGVLLFATQIAYAGRISARNWWTVSPRCSIPSPV